MTHGSGQPWELSRPWQPWQAIICSPLRRTLQTAALALAAHLERGVPCYAVEAAREFSQGIAVMKRRGRHGGLVALDG